MGVQGADPEAVEDGDRMRTTGREAESILGRIFHPDPSDRSGYGAWRSARAPWSSWTTMDTA
ncbi:hypothetical protein L083_0224 [Actinoplanes sp. N902-109]|nr:hypothetical protein L083_0224 [Actinoplanes sp. N902-109]